MTEYTITASQYTQNPPQEPEFATLQLAPGLFVSIDAAQTEPDTGHIVLSCSNGHDYRVLPTEALAVISIDGIYEGGAWEPSATPQDTLGTEDVVTVGDIFALLTVRQPLLPMRDIDVDGWYAD